MENAFSPNNPAIKLSDVQQEQLGAMQIYRGIMAFVRNSAGHNIIDTYTQEHALRFVAFIDLLLSLIKEAPP